MSEASRSEALDKSVRIALANGGEEETKAIVERATAFNDFLAQG